MDGIRRGRWDLGDPASQCNSRLLVRACCVCGKRMVLRLTRMGGRRSSRRTRYLSHWNSPYRLWIPLLLFRRQCLQPCHWYHWLRCRTWSSARLPCTSPVEDWSELWHFRQALSRVVSDWGSKKSQRVPTGEAINNRTIISYGLFNCFDSSKSCGHWKNWQDSAHCC